MTRLEGIEEICELAPLQQGMLFHALYAPRSSVYNLQLEFALEGDLDEGALEQAWRSLVERHRALRTSFVWERVEKPYQVVHHQAQLNIARHDWRALSAAEQDERRRSCVEENRTRLFDLTRPPLMRLALIVLSEHKFRLVWTFHHIILEGWSAAIVLSEFWKCYADLRAQRSPDLPAVRPYAEFIRWLQRQDHAAAEAYWRQRLSGFSTPTRLPIDRFVRTAPAHVEKVDRCSLALSKEFGEALKSLARSHRITLNTLVQGAWSILLSRYSGEQDVVFGAVVSGRPAQLPAVESMVGLFVNMLPARVKVNGDERLMPWLRELQLDQATMRQHEYSSLMQVQAWSAMPGGQPLFHTALAFQNWLGDFPSGQVTSDLRVTTHETHEASDQPLTLFVEMGDTLTLTLVYDVERFEPAAVRRMLTHCRMLLEGMAAHPQARLKDLPLLTEAERQQQLVEWNATAAAYPDRCLHALIEEQVQRTPDQTAVVFEQERLTYAELDRRANHLAHHLQRLGVGPEVLVGLFVERSVELVVGMVGILKAGAAYVPIDTAFPSERIAFMLADANARVVLTQASLTARLPAGRAQVVCLDAFEWTAADNATPSEAHVEPGHLAYVIYTSGSTGRPKGVGIEHRNIVNYVLGVAERLQFTPGMQHATVSTIAADLGNTVIFPALVTGGCLHILSQARAENAARLAEYFTRAQIDVLKIVPSHLAALQTGRHPEHVLPRRRLILGGEASRLDWVEQLREWSPTCKIYNHYGPTETTVGVLTYPVGPQLPTATLSGTLPVGRPLPNSRVYILDERGQPVPIGVQGELCIGGRGVARGYLNRPDLTAEKFLPDPFSPDADGRLYRTGDRARYLPDGTIEFCGRFDHQVKIHGYRIEPGEIEGALREQRGVRDAMVLARDDQPGNTQLVAYVVPTRAKQPLWGSHAVYVLPDGSPVAHLNKSETDYIYHEIFVLQAYLRHGITLGDGDCIVDAGANIGLFSVFANRVARNLRMVAFEPNPAAFACLQANADAWGPGVRCLPVGLSRENTSAELTFFEGFSLLSGFYADAATERQVVKTYALNQAAESPDGEPLAATIDELLEDRFQARTETAQLRTLSSVIAEEGLERIDLLKINVEKSEWDVLQGLSPGDWPKIRQLVIEVDQRVHVEPITTLLEREGYEVLVEQDPLLRKTELCYVYAIRPSAGRRLVRQQPADAHLRSLRPVDEEIVTPGTLRNVLKERLPPYMIPSAFVRMEKLPLTSNGKIDRKALPAPDRPVAVTGEFVEPCDPLEQALAGIWSKILKARRVGVHDNFFELGGHSLAAIRLLSEVQELTGKTLALATLFDAPTVAALADILRRDGGTPSWSSLVPIRPRGSKNPLFLVHAAHGHVLLYRQMVSHLGPDRPVYGLQSIGLNGDGRFDTTVEEMASRYVNEIVTVRPLGPYVLGGYCLGGIVALEIAQQLTAKGEKVEAVVLLDTYNGAAFSRSKELLYTPVHWLQNLWFHGANSLSIRGKERGKFLREKLDIARTRLGIRLRAAADAFRRLQSKKTHHRDPNLAVKTINDQAAGQYVARPYSGRVILIRSKGNFWGFANPSLGWSDILHGGLVIYELPVYAKGMLIEPFCRLLANAIDRCLDRRRTLSTHMIFGLVNDLADAGASFAACCVI